MDRRNTSRHLRWNFAEFDLQLGHWLFLVPLIYGSLCLHCDRCCKAADKSEAIAAAESLGCMALTFLLAGVRATSNYVLKASNYRIIARICAAIVAPGLM